LIRRRVAATAAVAVTLLATTGSVALYRRLRWIEPYTPRLERLSLPLPPGHEGLHGLRIGFVTDTHVGPFFTPVDAARATSLLAAERPDLILLGGDYVSEAPRHAPAAADVLADLAAAAPLGAYAVLGNHDLAMGADRVAAELEQRGIVVLRNRAVPLETGRGPLWIAGIDETLLGAPEPAAAFALVPAGAAVLALWHEPVYAEESAARGAFAQLSGHTHGGQVRLPRLGPLVLPADGRRFAAGLNHAGGMPVYTSRGVGVYRPPVRFNCPPEVTLITLTASEP